MMQCCLPAHLRAGNPVNIRTLRGLGLALQRSLKIKKPPQNTQISASNPGAATPADTAQPAAPASTNGMAAPAAAASAGPAPAPSGAVSGASGAPFAMPGSAAALMLQQTLPASTGLALGSEGGSAFPGGSVAPAAPQSTAVKSDAAADGDDSEATISQ